MPIFCSQCNKDFNFEDISADRPVFCPDCGLSATIIDTSELLQKTKNSSKSNDSLDTSSSLTDKIPHLIGFFWYSGLFLIPIIIYQH